MTGNSPWKAQDNVEPIQADTIGAIANIAGFNTLNGCGQTYSISDMIVTIAAGAVLHTSVNTPVAGNTVTLVSDPTNPRWTYQYVNSSGVAAIVSGTAAAVPSVPDFGENVTGSLTYVQAGLTIAGNALYKLDKRVFSQRADLLAGVASAYKSATQTFSATTSFADVSAASGNFAFAIAASEVWVADIWLPLTFTGTGGMKWQFTGPASPTGVYISGNYSTATGSQNADTAVQTFTAVTGAAFSAAFVSQNAAAGLSPGVILAAQPGMLNVRLVVRNGSTAGTVTLQGAQNSANGTTVIGLGAYMTARRVA